MSKTMKQEMQEAVMAGEKALRSLYAARENLRSAKNWGFFDMLGGGMLSDMVKHSKMNKASKLLEQAKYDLRAFQKELQDVNFIDRLNISTGSFLTFADFFFDGLVADYLVQSRIAGTLSEVDEAIRHIEEILRAVEMKINEMGNV